MHMKTKHVIIAALLLVALQAVALYILNHPFICSCGYVKIWEGVVNSSQNSQHIFDWYSFSHIIHGFIFYFFAWLIGRKRGWSVGTMFLLAVALSVGWEMLENTSFVIHRYRETTISLQYYGDSIVNSLADTACMALGFFLAYRWPVWAIITIAVAMELFVVWQIRDNLILNTIMIIRPFPAVLHWQAAGM